MGLLNQAIVPLSDLTWRAKVQRCLGEKCFKVVFKQYLKKDLVRFVMQNYSTRNSG